jgi:hypothetical protein
VNRGADGGVDLGAEHYAMQRLGALQWILSTACSLSTLADYVGTIRSVGH